MNPPLPEQGPRPYRYQFSPRNLGADALRAFLPGGINIADRLTGNNLRYGIDRMFGGVSDRMRADEASYMRDMMRNDPGNTSFLDRLRQALSRNREQPPVPSGAETFGLGDDSERARVESLLRNSPPIPQPGLQNRVGAGRGTTIAQGPAAQSMFEGMRNSANAAMTRNQARNAMTNMFAGEER